MKRIFAAFMAALFLALFPACERKNTAVPKTGALRVITVNFPPYDFVRAIAGDRAELSMLLPPGSESHSFEPSPRDIIAIQNSDVFIYTGGESDSWATRILESVDTPGKKIVRMMDAVEVVEEEIVEGMQEETPSGARDGENGAEEAEYDEHVWTSPKNARRIVWAITEALCDADGANAVFYRQNAGSFVEDLDDLDREFQSVVDGAKRKTIIFGDRFPFRYFADAYGLSYFAAFPGCATETEPGAATVAFLISKIRAEKIPVVFYIELSSEKMADTVAVETGAKKLLFHSCHNISRRDFDSGITFLEIQRANVARLREALQ